MNAPYRTTLVSREPHPSDAALYLTEHYAFTSFKNEQRYIVQVDYFTGDVCAIKFYPKSLKLSKDKYRKITNYGDFYGVILTVVTLAKEILSRHKNISFAFYGERTIIRSDSEKWLEPVNKTQRFQAYSRFLSRLVGDLSFHHRRYTAISCYLLINHLNADPASKEMEYKKLFSNLYNELVNLSADEEENHLPSQSS